VRGSRFPARNRWRQHRGIEQFGHVWLDPGSGDRDARLGGKLYRVEERGDGGGGGGLRAQSQVALATTPRVPSEPTNKPVRSYGPVAGADQGPVGQDDVQSQDRIPGDASPRRDRATGDTGALSLRSMFRRASSSRAACPAHTWRNPNS
jgi:hypothetical protein